MVIEPESAPGSPEEDDRQREQRHHAVIAGTGRAGTSFVTMFLSECGLDAASPEDFFDDRARAGLEHHLLDERAPYVVKDPWLFVYCEDIDPALIAIDALIVPVRELMAAATSRILQDRISMAEGAFGQWPTSDVNGVVIGGAVYSLDPVDEARILAVGFHKLIHWATARQVALYLLEFPRTVNDRDYLIDTLWPWLSLHCDRQQAEAAYAAVADPQLVRIKEPRAEVVARVNLASTLDRDAMAILLKERNSQLASAEQRLAETREAFVRAEDELALIRAAMARVREELASTTIHLENVRRQLELSTSQLGQRNEELGARNAELAGVQARLDTESAELVALRRTLSWRITRPLRGLRRVGRRGVAKG